MDDIPRVKSWMLPSRGPSCMREYRRSCVSAGALFNRNSPVQVILKSSFSPLGTSRPLDLNITSQVLERIRALSARCCHVPGLAPVLRVTSTGHLIHLREYPRLPPPHTPRPSYAVGSVLKIFRSLEVIARQCCNQGPCIPQGPWWHAGRAA